MDSTGAAKLPQSTPPRPAFPGGNDSGVSDFSSPGACTYGRWPLMTPTSSNGLAAPFRSSASDTPGAPQAKKVLRSPLVGRLLCKVNLSLKGVMFNRIKHFALALSQVTNCSYEDDDFSILLAILQTATTPAPSEGAISAVGCSLGLVTAVRCSKAAILPRLLLYLFISMIWV